LSYSTYTRTYARSDAHTQPPQTTHVDQKQRTHSSLATATDVAYTHVHVYAYMH